MKTPKIIPRKKYVLVKLQEPESKENDNGLIIPDTEEQEQKAQGLVEAVGSDITDVKVGDKVVFGAFAGDPIETKEGGKIVKRKLLHDDDVIAFIK